MPSWDFRDDVTTCDGIIIKGQVIFIPKGLRQKYIQLAYTATKGLIHAYNEPSSLYFGLT